jgi:hypothetical protein
LRTHAKGVPQQSLDHFWSLSSRSLNSNFYDLGTHFPDEPIFETPLSRRPGQPDIGALLTAHTPQRAVVMPPTLRRRHRRDS